MLAYIIGVIILIFGIANGQVLAGVVLCFWCCVVGMAIQSGKKNNGNAASTQKPSEQPKPPSIPSNPPHDISSNENSNVSAKKSDLDPPTQKAGTSEHTPAGPSSSCKASNTTARADGVANKKNGDIIEYLKSERKVAFFVHFTPVDNVGGILRYGLRPRTAQSVKGQWTDPDRLDGQVDCSCLSISFPNYQMLYRKALERKYSYVILRISVDALCCLDKDDISFFPNNAASSGLIGTFNSHLGLSAARELFIDTAVYGSKKATRKELGIPSYFTTYPQAEVLVRGTIPACYIKEIVVSQASIRNAVLNACRSNNMNIPVRVDDSLFKPRCDWQFWKNSSANYSS